IAAMCYLLVRQAFFAQVSIVMCLIGRYQRHVVRHDVADESFTRPVRAESGILDHLAHDVSFARDGSYHFDFPRRVRSGAVAPLGIVSVLIPTADEGFVDL